MPLYLYRCTQGHTEERLERPDAPRERACWFCGQPATRIPAAASVQRDGTYSYRETVAQHTENA